MKILRHIKIGLINYLNKNIMKKLIKNLKFKIFGGKIEEDIEKDDELISVINPKIKKTKKTYSSSYYHINSSYYSNSGCTSMDEYIDYKDYRRKQLKDELMNDRELLMSVLSDLREEKIEKIKNNIKNE